MSLRSRRKSAEPIDIPDAPTPDVVGGPLVEKVAYFLQLAPPGACVVEKIAKLARVRLHLHVVLHVARITIQHQHLVLRPTASAHGVHDCAC